MPVVGLLHPGSSEANHYTQVAFIQGLAETGYVQGKNVAIEYRWANGQYDKLPTLATELVRLPVAAITSVAPVATLAAKQATSSIPIVFGLGSDPVRDGIVANLARPGGNITGATFFSNLLDAKRMDLLHRMVPGAKVFGVMLNPKNTEAEFQKNQIQEAARALELDIVLLQASSNGEIDNLLANLKEQHIEAIFIAADTFLANSVEQIAYSALRFGIPTAFPFREQAMAGCLMSYGASITAAIRQAGTYVGRILKGEKPGDLPVQQPTKFEFIINMKTAKALGLSIPYSVQVLADELIE